jgi:DNA-directed RNA polymerase subunit M/transcription elongation factor TFIIS
MARCHYDCAECNHRITLSQSGIRTVYACRNCEAVQTFERVETAEEARP